MKEIDALSEEVVHFLIKESMLDYSDEAKALDIVKIGMLKLAIFKEKEFQESLKKELAASVALGTFTPKTEH